MRESKETDRKQLVRRRLSSLNLSAGQKEEVIAELAAHLEDSEDESDAPADAPWHELMRSIERAKREEGAMNYRTKSLWLPALITLLGASVSLMLTQLFRMQPQVVRVAGVAIPLYWRWLASLPICGAVGAYLSRRAQGAALARVVAGLSPAWIMLIVMGLVLPWGLAIDGVHFITLVGFGAAVATDVVIPGVALLIGALPFLGRSAALEATRGAA